MTIVSPRLGKLGLYKVKLASVVAVVGTRAVKLLELLGRMLFWIKEFVKVPVRST